MKKLLFTVAAVITFNSLAIAQISTTDFRGFNWGSSLSQIQTNEKANQLQKNDKVNNTDDVLLYEDQLAGSDVYVYYQFNDNDKLVNGTYYFLKKYTDPQLHLQEYNKFKELLTLKYGKPIIDKQEWSENTEPFEKEDYGQAISDGYLDLIAIWYTNRTEIKISLLTMNNHPLLQIRYTAKSLDELENKEELKNALPKL